ncbi:MAG: hypothetical protein LBT43_23475 [Prevotella sp.]|jgi:hypothetical protein|nr:hypothetical protein [Prevotella sp.]
MKKKTVKYISVSVLLALGIMWPVIYWYNEIALDEILFINTWLELGVSGVFLYYFIPRLLHKAIKQYDTSEKEKADQDILCKIRLFAENIQILVNTKGAGFNVTDIDFKEVERLYGSLNNKFIDIGFEEFTAIRNIVSNGVNQTNQHEITRKANYIINKINSRWK